MKALEMLEQYWEYAKRLFTFAQYCIDNDIHLPVCHDFWMWNVYASMAVAGLIVFLVSKSLIKHQLEFYRNKKRLEARKIVADAETMEGAKWREETTLDTELSHEELAAKMRDAINTRGNAVEAQSKAGA